MWQAATATAPTVRIYHRPSEHPPVRGKKIRICPTTGLFLGRVFSWLKCVFWRGFTVGIHSRLASPTGRERLLGRCIFRGMGSTVWAEAVLCECVLPDSATFASTHIQVHINTAVVTKVGLLCQCDRLVLYRVFGVL